MGDIFICQDADDFPHPQRVEVVRYFFEKLELDHLQHLCDQREKWEMLKDFDQITYIYPEKIEDSWWLLPGYCQGVPCISRSLFERLKLSDKRFGEDNEFNKNAYAITSKRILVPRVLYQYRIWLSSRSGSSELFYPEIISE